ncbi:hypothetical protein MMC28_001436 [Mycoblastus sanguinarius]|nr:hypothetical protein [Mycoblastus sanguinarius]
MLDESRAAMASYLDVPVDELVFLPNATTAINVVLRSLRYSAGDVILHLSTLYGAIGKLIEYLHESSEVDGANVAVEYPVDDDLLVSNFQAKIHSVRREGGKVRIAVFDTVSSMPGVRVPWERLVEVCKAEGVLSMVDGAHSVGQIKLGLAKVQPDFFTSNCHKWLFVPRACAFFYVPKRNQHLIRTSLPTSHGFQPLSRGSGNDKDIMNPMMVPSDGASKKSNFEILFQFVATMDSSPYLCIEEALKFREEVCGGEERIMKHCVDLSNAAGKLAAEILRTEVMENGDKTLTRCSFVNVKLPLTIGDGDGKIPELDASTVVVWLVASLAKETDTYAPCFLHAGSFWTRLSGQIYLELDDYARGARALARLCDRAKKREYLQERPRL